MYKILSCVIFGLMVVSLYAQKKSVPMNDSNTPLHLLRADYTVPYVIPKVADVKQALDRIRNYLDSNTPFEMVDKNNKSISDFSKIDENASLKKGAFRIVSYEWGVTYGAMHKVSKITDDTSFKKYADDRLNFIAKVVPSFAENMGRGDDWADKGPFRNLLDPKALDDCGAMCTAMIKAKMDGSDAPLQFLIDKHIAYIMTKEHRLDDGTLARNRPQPNTVWLDDMYMGVPALAHMGKMTGEQKYFDEAARQILLFGNKMFDHSMGIFYHGWVQSMTDHPQFHWARANGWALLTLTEVLDVLPEKPPDFSAILSLYKKHVKGLQKYQSGLGFWHQLLNKSDSYLETSATAIYTYCIAHGINKGWLDPLAYAPTALLGWNALFSKINKFGQVEGTCVGTGMAFDPAFYYHRPVSPYAAHGYG
ncbi:MAG TPA: glycoside hydrolase family 88 protein, partial [Saprospiraceae bacterium]|nr:glycoside hydrolase family 88 protein [Saprospiraceae bacterium]